MNLVSFGYHPVTTQTLIPEDDLRALDLRACDTLHEGRQPAIHQDAGAGGARYESGFVFLERTSTGSVMIKSDLGSLDLTRLIYRGFPLMISAFKNF